MRIEWLPTAIDSLQNQLGSIERRNPDVALSYSRRVEAAVGRSGRRPGTRELVIARTPFLLVCRGERDVIAVLRPFHGAQDRPTMP